MAAMNTPDYTQMVPGFDFLQGLMRNAGAGLPHMSQWIAPSLDPAEVDKRIQELRAVQFWLEQNSKVLAATIQALEVQRMTLATLETMNMPVADLRDALKLRPQAWPSASPAPASPGPAAPAPSPVAAAPARPSVSSRAQPARSRRGNARPKPDAGAPAAGSGGAGADPLQWWGALTRQFSELAAQALKEAPAAMPGAAAPTPADTASAPASRKSRPAPARRRG